MDSPKSSEEHSAGRTALSSKRSEQSALTSPPTSPQSPLNGGDAQPSNLPMHSAFPGAIEQNDSLCCSTQQSTMLTSLSVSSAEIPPQTELPSLTPSCDTLTVHDSHCVVTSPPLAAAASGKETNVPGESPCDIVSAVNGVNDAQIVNETGTAADVCEQLYATNAASDAGTSCVQFWASAGERAAFFMARNACLEKLRRLGAAFPAWAQKATSRNSATSAEWHTGAIQQCNNWTDIGVYLRVFESINPRVVQSANKLTAALSETVKSLDALRAKRESPNNEGNASSVEPCVSGLNEISRLPAEKDSEPVNSWNPSQWSRDVSQSSMSTTATPSPTSATSSAERSSYQKTSADAPSHQPPSAHPPASGNAEHEFDVPKGLSQLAGDSATSSYLGLCSSKTNKKTNNAHLNNIPVPGSKSTASSAALAKSASELPVVPSQRSTTQRAQRAPGALRFEPLEGPKREVSFDCHGESSYNFRTAAISETNIAPSQRGSFATSSCASGLPERETASKAYSVDELFRSLDIPEDTSPVAAALTLVARAIDVPVDDVKKIISSGDSGFNNKSMMPDRRRDSVLSQREDMSRSTIDCLLPMFSPVAQRTTEAGAYQSQPFCKNESKSCRVAGDGSSLNISAVYVNREDQDLCLEPQFQSKHVLKCSTTHLDSSQKTTRVCSSRQPSAVVPSSPIRTTCGVTPPIASGASSPLMSSFSDCPAFSHEATVQSSTTVRHSTGLRPEGFASHQRSMKGVSFDRSKRNWEASWLDARTGKRVKKCFSEGRWGSSARDMAILARKEAEDSGVISTRQQQFSPSLSCLSPERKNDHHSVPATITVGRPPQTEVVVAQRGSSRLLVPVSSDCDYDNSASISLSSSSRSRDQSAGGCATQERSHASSSRTLASVEDDLLLQQIAVRVANLFPQMALARASQQGVSEPSAGLKKETPEEQQACRRVRHDEKQNVSYSNHYPSCVAHLPLSAPPVQPLATPSSSSSLPSPPPASDSCSLSSPRLCAMPETAAAHNREPSAHATVRSARSSAHPENLVPTQSNGGYPVHYSTISSTAHHSTSLDCNKEHVSQASLSSDAVGSFKAALSLSEAVPTKVASSSPGSSLAPSGCVNNNENKSVSDGNICGGAEDIPSSVAVGNHQSVLLSYPSTTGQNSPVHEFYTHNKSTAPHYPCPSSQCSPQVQDNSFQSVYPDGDVAPLDSPSTFVPRVVQSSPPVRCELDSSSAPTERSTSAVADGKKKKEQGVPAFASLHQTIEDITPNISAPCSPVSTVLKLVHDYVSSSPNAAVSKNLHGNASSVLSVQQTSVSGMSDSTLAAPKMDSPKLQDLDEHVRSLWRKRQAARSSKNAQNSSSTVSLDYEPLPLPTTRPSSNNHPTAFDSVSEKNDCATAVSRTTSESSELL